MGEARGIFYNVSSIIINAFHCQICPPPSLIRRPPYESVYGCGFKEEFLRCTISETVAYMTCNTLLNKTLMYCITIKFFIEFLFQICCSFECYIY